MAELTQDQKDAAELSTLNVKLSAARVEWADAERRLSQLRDETASQRALLQRAKDGIETELAALRVTRDREAAETGAVTTELNQLRAEREQAREVIRKAVVIRPEVEALEQRAIEARQSLDQAQHEEADVVGKVNEKVTQLVTLDEKILDEAQKLRESRDSRAVLETEMTVARQEQLAQIAEAKDLLARLDVERGRLADRERRHSETENRLKVWEATLEERDRISGVVLEEARVKLKGIEEREARILSGSEDLAKAKIAFQQEAEPAMERVRQLQGELEVKEQWIRDRRAEVDSLLQTYHRDNSALKLRQRQIEQQAARVQQDRAEIKRVGTQYGLNNLIPSLARD